MESNYLKRIRQQVENKKICIYPMGIAGKSMRDKLLSKGIETDCFCDTNEKLWGSSYHGVTCISLPELIQMNQDELIVIVESLYYKEIKEQLVKSGIQNIVRIYFEKIAIEEYIQEHEEEVRQKIAQVIDICADERSKEVYRHIAAAWFMDEVDDDYFEPIYSKGQYFDPELIKLKEDEVFVDAGAYIGDTAEQFLEACNGKFEKAFLFELDPVIYEKLCQNVKQLNANSTGAGVIECRPYGLSDFTGQVEIVSGDSTSSVAGRQRRSGGVVAKVTTIDESLSGEDVSFIKMDIEGAEMSALRGSRSLIENRKPLLAICIYHGILDLLNVPLYLKVLVPEYQIYIRHYTDESLETVCYAVPPERLK